MMKSRAEKLPEARAYEFERVSGPECQTLLLDR